MKNIIIAVGPTTQNNTLVNGQTMMFQLLVDELQHKKIKNITVDIGQTFFKNSHNRKTGSFTIQRSIDYFIILARLVRVLLIHRKQNVYLTTAQSKIGFFRDYFIINLAKLFGHKITTHQFGANYIGFFSSQSKFLQKQIKRTLEKADRIIVEGDYTKKQFNFLSNYEKKVYSLPNGLPEKIDINQIPEKSIAKEQPINLLYLSNLIEGKGFWDVLEAINILVNLKKLKINAVFSGKFIVYNNDKKFSSVAEAKRAFENYITKNNLDENITYREGLYGIEKAEAFKRTHFFLLPSYYVNEGQPVSILESLAYGCVSIVTEYRLIPTMINKNNGFFVSPRAPHEIADIIDKLSERPSEFKKYSRAAIEQYKEKFTADKYTEQLISLL